LGDKGMKGESGPRGFDGAGTQYWTQSPSDGDAIYYNAGNIGIGTDSPTHHLHVSGDSQVKLKLESTGGNPEIQFTQPDSDDNTTSSSWMVGQSSSSNAFFITKHDAGSGYQLEITKNSHKIKSDNGGLYLTKEGNPGNSTIDLINDNLLDYTAQGGNSAVPAAVSMLVKNADGFAQFGVSTSNGHIINTINNEEPAGTYQKGIFGLKIRSEYNDGTMAPVLIGRGARHMAYFGNSSLTIQNANEELSSAGVYVRGGSHTNTVESGLHNASARFQLNCADYEITGDFRNRTIFSRTFTHHSSPGLDDALLITHEVKGVHKGRMIINRDGNIHLENSMKLGIGKEPSTSLDINGNMAINNAINFRRKESELNGGSPATQAFIRAKHIQEGVQTNSNLDPVVPDPDNFRTDMPSGMEIGPFLHVGYTGETAHSNTMKEFTGKLASVANSNKITGTDTKFLSECREKDIIQFGSSVHMIASIESDTELTLTDNWDWWKTPATYTYVDITDQSGWVLAERAGLRVSPQIGSAAAICFSDNNNTNAMTYLVSGTTSSGWITKDYKTAISVRQSTGDVCIGKRLPDCKLHVWSDDEPGKAQVKISAHQGANPTSDGTAKPAELVIENGKAMLMTGVKESKGHIINRPRNGLETCIRSEYLVDYPDPRGGTSGTIPAGSFAPISFGHGGGAKYQMQDKAFFNGTHPFTQYNPTGHFFLANHPWAEHTTYERDYAGKFYYSPEHRGMLCNGITGVTIRCLIPIDPTCSYRVTIRAKQTVASTLPGENVFYAGVESLDYNYNVLSTDDRNSYNYGIANSSSDLKDNVGVSQTFTAEFHGYNPPAPAEGDANKFDPIASFFNIGILANYNSNGGERPSNGQTIIELVEVKKLDT
jgi:hypothetical protein